MNLVIFTLYIKCHMDNFLKDFIYLFLERGERRKRGRETSMCGFLSHAPYWGPGLQPRHVPCLGIESATLWFAGWHSIHQATPARALVSFLYNLHNNSIWHMTVNS